MPCAQTDPLGRSCSALLHFWSSWIFDTIGLPTNRQSIDSNNNPRWTHEHRAVSLWHARDEIITCRASNADWNCLCHCGIGFLLGCLMELVLLLTKATGHFCVMGSIIVFDSRTSKVIDNHLWEQYECLNCISGLSQLYSAHQARSLRGMGGGINTVWFQIQENLRLLIKKTSFFPDSAINSWVHFL